MTAMNGGGWLFETDYVHEWAYFDRVFSEKECRKIIKDNLEFSTARIVGDNTQVTKIRQSETCWLFPNEKNNWIFDRLSNIAIQLNNQYFKFDLFGMVEGIQLTKYNAPSGFYGSHMDKIFNNLPRKLSLTVQLSDPEDYEGGELLLHTSKNPIIMDKEIGKLIAFPSYTLHEVTPVTKGTRYSLVVWITGKPFK